MGSSSPLAGAFPTEAGIPEAWRHAPSDVGLRLILDGSVERWKGGSEEIRSAVCVRDADGRLAQLGLGPAARADAEAGRFVDPGR